MNQYQVERRLCWCYGLLAALLGVCSICIGIVYSHWNATLDVCPGTRLENTNCGCIFYGLYTTQYFNGGHNSYCWYAILAPLPPLVYALFMALFHMYRVCINNVGQFEDEKSTAMEEIEGESIVVTSRAQATRGNDSVIYCWMPNTILAVLFAIYNLVHASIITDGFLKTCTQYRINLVSLFRASGDHAVALHFRLSCQAIFDFMDYTLKDAPGSRRGDVINTGAALTLALLAAWLAAALWTAVAVLAARRLYREWRVLACCGN